MVAAPAQPPTRPPALKEAVSKATEVWQDDLQQLFHRAKDRFPDVVWDLIDEEVIDAEAEEVWGHKALVYARAPPSFQARYFSFRPPPVPSPLPYGASPTPTLPAPATSALSLNLGTDYNYAESIRSISPSPFRSGTPNQQRAVSPAPSTIGMLTRIPLSHNPALFFNELEYLYTGKGIGAAFEFLFDANEKGRAEVDDEEARIDKLRKDLVFMWRSRLYSDVRLELHGNMSSLPSSLDEETTAVFSSNRFILVARSPYFYDQLITYGLRNAPPPGEPATLRLPSPPFTPPSLHFALGFLYSGTLNFSNRTYDLDTAFALLSSATYLQLQTLYDEVQARLVQEMLHGLFHAFLDFSEYERITGGRWGTGGCRCRQCARRAPRTLLFAVRDDVQNAYLDRGARRALVGLFGDGWCTSEFASLPQKTKDGLMTGLAKRTIPLNVFPLLFAAQAALKRLGSIKEAWADGVKDMVMSARSAIDKVICSEAEKCFSEHDWVDIMENDGQGRFEDGERVEWVMDAVKRGMSESNAGVLYQTLVSAILLRPHPTEPNESLLSSTSQIRVQVEQTRMDLLRWLRRRWVGVRQEGGFDTLEGWALKEISHEIDVPAEDLLTPSTAPTRAPLTRTGLRPVLSKVEDATERDSMSTAPSLRASILNKNMARTNTTDTAAPRYTPRGSTARSVASGVSRASSRLSTATTETERQRKESRPDSKLSPVTPTPMDVDVDAEEPEDQSMTNTDNSLASLAEQAAATVASRRNGHKDTSDTASIASVHQMAVTNVQRPKSMAPSVASVSSTRSHASTIRRNQAAAAATGSASTSATLRPPKVPARPPSVASKASKKELSTASSSTFATPRESLSSRTRKVSTTSTVSNISVRTSASRSPHTPPPPLPGNRPRRSSEASVRSASTTAARRVRKVSTASTTNTATAGKQLAVRKTPSTTSIRSTASKSPTSRRQPVKKSPTSDEKKHAGKGLSPINKPLPKMPSKENVDPASLPNTSSTMTVKGKARADVLAAESKSTRTSSDKGSRSTVRRKESNDTITLSRLPGAKSDVATEIMLPQPRGATLDIGIPCIISSKRKRFRAFARYIGEVEGERGPWVGVEVPVGDSWMDERDDGRQWHDGSWGGVRYFEVGASPSEWGDDDRMVRRRRADGLSSSSHLTLSKGIKREGDQLSVDRKKRFRSASPSVSDMSTAEYRGLFVRPQQVLYVVDAVGSDL